jgi:hypothetical protein
MITFETYTKYRANGIIYEGELYGPRVSGQGLEDGRYGYASDFYHGGMVDPFEPSWYPTEWNSRLYVVRGGRWIRVARDDSSIDYSRQPSRRTRATRNYRRVAPVNIEQLVNSSTTGNYNTV